MNMFCLQGKTAIVTGANTGLGQGICLALAEAGANIVGVARRSCIETKAAVEKTGVRFLEVLVDLSTPKAIEEIFNQALQEFQKIDILVNNAGIILRDDAIAVTEEDWDTVISINQKTVFFLCQRFAKMCVERNQKGKIINLCSMLSYQGGIRVPAYCASKSAVMGLTKALCNEWAAKGICVNGIAPGYMATNNTENLRKDEARSQEILARIPTGRFGTPEDVGGAAVFLASSASDYVNGFTLAVDGGWLAR